MLFAVFAAAVGFGYATLRHARLVVWTLLTCALGAGVFIVALSHQCCRGAHADTTKTSARFLRQAAETWRVDRKNPHVCPTAEILKRDRFIDTGSKLTDAWDSPFLITCSAEETTVRSAGPDKRFDTADDIVVPNPAQTP